MKVLTSIVYLALVVPASANAQTDELSKIHKTLNDYMIGGDEQNGERIASAFHPQAMMKFIRDGQYTEVNAADFFRNGVKPGTKLDRTCEVASVDITGHAAMAKLLLKYADKTFTDYMALLKIDGEWKIINKSFYLEAM